MVILVSGPAGSGRRVLVLVEPRSGPSVVRKDGSAWLRDERLQGVAADCLAAKLRPGNVHSAEGWEEVLLPIVDRYRRCPTEGRGRGDAAFARPEIYEALERRGLYRKSRLIQIAIMETADAVQPLNLTRTPTAVGRAPGFTARHLGDGSNVDVRPRNVLLEAMGIARAVHRPASDLRWRLFQGLIGPRTLHRQPSCDQS